jgi:hypothetical protein
MRPRRTLLLLPIFLLLITASCQDNQQELTTLRQQNKKLESELTSTRQKLTALENQITNPRIVIPRDLTLKSNAKFDDYRFLPDYEFTTAAKTTSENEPFIFHFSTEQTPESIHFEDPNPAILYWHAPWGDLIDDHPRRK